LPPGAEGEWTPLCIHVYFVTCLLMKIVNQRVTLAFWCCTNWNVLVLKKSLILRHCVRNTIDYYSR